ncbi:hypothetical protein [Beijerinckia sp. L45]|uniref:hyaluronate lyase N-terminal domain-containing protein n=1 Tax=Beijerinckia sp. L45 TaxID=1641855 RepID=UPI00131E1550|nr:hypothetical protein [Beijerinckia sp. L45]
MSVQVKRRREAAAFLQTFVGAQGELLVDTTNNRVQVHDGATPGGFAAAKLAEVVTNTRTAVADANYAALPTDRLIAITALTVPRTITLPPASAYPTGTRLLVIDESGASSAAMKIAIAAVGSDRINGATFVAIGIPNGYIALASNGAGKWTITDQSASVIGALTGAPIGAFLFTPGGDGVVSIYRMDVARGQIPRTSTASGIASTVVTLSGTNDASLFYGGVMAGVSYARIWNITKTPAQSAWIKAVPAANQLGVTNAADVTTWSVGDTLQIGDPAAMHGGLNVVALDISPMQLAVFGMAFPQVGILAKSSVTGVDATVAMSGTATNGSFVTTNAVNDGVAMNGMALIPCSTPSPISNTNLIFVRETITAPNTLGTALFSSLALFG